MDTNFINIDSIAIGLSSYTDIASLDLNDNEYLVVGQRANQNSNIFTKDTKYNLIVNNNGIGINATRNEVINNNGLYISNDIICKGKIIANSIELNNVTLSSNITNETLTKLIQSVNSNLLFFTGYNNDIIDIDNNFNFIDNIYTPSYLTLGSLSDTYCNLYPLNIVNTGNGTINNIQLCIQNDTDNNSEPNKIRIGTIGNSSNSPAIFSTTDDLPLEFHIGRSTSFMNNLYSNGLGIPDYENNLPPALIINKNNNIGINTSIIDDINYNLYKRITPKQIDINNYTSTPNLKVDGISYFNNIIIHDYNTNTPKNIDDLYIRSAGLTLKANQIIGTDFNVDIFRFNSNLSVGKQGDNFSFNVYSHAFIHGNFMVDNNTTLFNTIVNGTCEFNDIATFYDNVLFNADLNVNNNLYLDGNLFIEGTRINISNIYYANNDFNIDNGSNIVIGGRLGVGVINTDSYDNQLTVNKRSRNNFEILLQDFNNYSSDSTKVFIGHSEDFMKNDDNSFIIFAQKSIKKHNIYLYAGKDLNNSSKIPNLSIMQNNTIGINTNIPSKTLDVIGDFVCNDYYIRLNNKIYKNKILLDDNSNIYINKINNLNINFNNNNISSYNNTKSFNVLGGINSYNGYFENNDKICNFKFYNNTNAFTLFNLGIGCSDPSNVPLQIRNTSIKNNNNSIIRFYRGIRGGGINNNADYSGIDFCEFNTDIPNLDHNKFKWYIYKYHIDNNKFNHIGPLTIGYTHNTINPTNNAINIYYNNQYGYHIDINNPIVSHNYNKDVAMSIHGNLEVMGNINIVGNFNFKNNGFVVGNFSNIVSDLIINNNITQGNLTNDDISLIGNKIILLPTKTSVIGFKDDWILNNINYIANINNTNDNIPLYVYQNNYNISSCKFVNKTYNFIDQPEISKIELTIIDQNNNLGSIKNKIEFILKGYNDDISILEFTPITPYSIPFITFYTNKTNNYINIGNNNNSYNTNNGSLIYPDIALHINDNSKYLLQLTNIDHTPIINMHKINNSNINWLIQAPDIDNNFNLSYYTSELNNNFISSNNIFTITNKGSIYINSIPSSFLNNNNTFNLNSVYNKSSIILTNQYTNNFLINNNSFISIPNSNLIYNYNNSFLNNIIYNHFNYTIFTSNLPFIDINNNAIINYNLYNSNISFNNSLNLIYHTNISNISIDYRYLNINNNDLFINNINSTVYKNIDIIPSIISINNNITYSIDNSCIISKYYDLNINISNYNFYNYYFIPDSPLINLTFNSSSSNLYDNVYNIIINTFLTIDTNINEIPTEYILLTNYNIINNIIVYTSNIIWYDPIPNIIIPIINVNFNNNYLYYTDLDIPIDIVNFNNIYFNSNISVDPFNNVIINSYTNFLNNNNTVYDLTPYILQYHLISSNIFNYLIDLDINGSNNVINLNIPIIFNDYYTIYDFNNHLFNMQISILFNNYLPHISFQNNILNNTNDFIHKIYSYDGFFKLYVDNIPLLSIDSNANTTIYGDLNIDNLFIKGALFDKFGNNIFPDLNSDIYTINSSNFLINSTNILLNPSNNGGIIINGNDRSDISNNIFQINNFDNDANFITLNSSTNASFIHFTSTNYDSNCTYRIGLNNSEFGFWVNNDVLDQSGYIDGKPNSMNSYNKIFGFTYDINTNLTTYDINGNFNLLSDLKFNNIITIYVNPSASYQLEVNGNASINGNIQISGNILTSSDKRYKNNIIKITDALDKVTKLSGYTFFNTLNNENQTGLIAQEVEKIIPEAISKNKEGYLSIAYGNLMGLIIESIKELKSDIDLIKNKLDI